MNFIVVNFIVEQEFGIKHFMVNIWQVNIIVLKDDLGNYINLLDHYINLLENVDLSENYVDLSENYVE